ncbi:MAG: nucleotidyltransferase domain-containing protein [Armatimonadia bacterium]
MNETIALCRGLVPKGGLLIHLVRTGSHAYGTNTPQSDSDYRGIFLPAPSDLLGLHHCRHVEQKDPDVVLKGLDEFVRLALLANPNILEQLFIDDENFLGEEGYFALFREHRKLFLSQLARRTYTGYAWGQLQKMQAGHTRDLGAKRKELIERFGFDTKNCSHVFRLIMQGRHLLETGELRVRLGPAEVAQLKSIRSGELFKTLSEARYAAEQEIRKIESVKSPLPEEPDRERIEALVVATQRDWVRER